MTKLIVGVFALACLAAPLFATEAPTTASQEEATTATAMEEKKVEKAAECAHCKKPMSECGCKKGKAKKNKKS